MSTELYPTTLPSTNRSMWPVSGSGGEVDLRQEFEELLYGSTTEVAKGRPGILRRMRKDTGGNLVVCPCVDEKTNEPDRDSFCQYCWGEGYLWDEEEVVYYKMLVSSHEGLVRKRVPMKAGVSNVPFTFFYLESYVLPEPQDKIVEITLAQDGGTTVPFYRNGVYRISTAEDFRSDNGRIEYWRIATTKETIRSTWWQR